MDTEEVGMTFNGIGTTVMTNVKNKTFHIRMGADCKEWLTDPRILEDGSTVGQANQAWLYEKLSNFLEACK